MDSFIDILVWKEEKLYYVSYSNFIFEVININFQQIWHFNTKDTGCMGLRLIITLMQTVGRFDDDLMPLILNKGALFTPGIEQNIELFVNNEKI